VTAQEADTLRRDAERVADCFAESGYAFIEDDKIEGLAEALKSFLSATDIPVNPARRSHSTPDCDAPFPHEEPTSLTHGAHPTTGTMSR